MQEVTASKTSTSDHFELSRTGALVDTSSQTRAFADFMGLMSQSGTGTYTSAQGNPWSFTQEAGARADSVLSASGAVSPVASSFTAANTTNNISPQAAGLQTASSLAPSIQAANAQLANAQASSVQTSSAQTSSAQVAAAQNAGTQNNGTQNSGAQTSGSQTAGAQTRQTVSEASLNTAKNTPVSRAAFEETRPLLAKAGLSTTEIEDLSARVQAGTLTWGKLIQTLGSHMSGAKKPVTLSTGETQNLQLLFQKLGFAADQATQMVQSVASGDSRKTLANIQTKLSTMPDDSTLNLSKDQLSTLFNALRLPQAAADKLLQTLGPESTVADMKTAMSAVSQGLQEQHAKTGAGDITLAKSLGKIMEQDVDKATRDTTKSTATASSDSGGGKVSYELKTKDPSDTGWFSEHEKGQRKSSDDSWRDFLTKVRTDTAANANSSASAGTQTSQAAQSSGKDALDALTSRAGLSSQATAAQQAKSDTSQLAKAYDKTTAPKMLDQVSEALLKDLGQGRKQLTVQLDPEDLGKLSIILQVKGKDVSAVLHAEDAQTANMLNSHLESIKKTLEDQGLKVQNLEVQTGLPSHQDQQGTMSADEHNQAQERQELSRIMSQLRMLRTDSADMAPDMQNTSAQAILADHGLHIIA